MARVPARSQDCQPVQTANECARMWPGLCRLQINVATRGEDSQSVQTPPSSHSSGDLSTGAVRKMAHFVAVSDSTLKSMAARTECKTIPA